MACSSRPNDSDGSGLPIGKGEPRRPSVEALLGHLRKVLDDGSVADDREYLDDCGILDGGAVLHDSESGYL